MTPSWLFGEGSSEHSKMLLSPGLFSRRVTSWRSSALGPASTVVDRNPSQPLGNATKNTLPLNFKIAKSMPLCKLLILLKLTGQACREACAKSVRVHGSSAKLKVNMQFRRGSKVSINW